MCIKVLKNIIVLRYLYYKNKVGGHNGKKMAVRSKLVKAFLNTKNN